VYKYLSISTSQHPLESQWNQWVWR
jgi:hypothetical protein